MVLNIVFMLYVIAVTVSSIWMGYTFNEVYLVMTALLFLISLLIERKYPRLGFFQIVTLALFHWCSQLNWCQPLYMLLAFKECYRVHNLKRSILISLLFVSVYSTIRISYLPDTLYNVLVTFYDVISFMLVVIAVYYIIKVEKEKQLLYEEKHHLSTHDPLTSLLNYQEYHKQLAEILQEEERFKLILIDCTDLKSMNNEQGYQSGNEILIQVADFLRDAFADAYIMAHYGGDEFAVVVKLGDRKSKVSRLKVLLNDRLPKELRIEITYGYAVYPDDGGTKDELISAAEQKLFAMKRERWLKREEQMLRAEKLRVVGELAAGIAHEIRNPLTTVRGFIQLSKQNGYNIAPWYELIMQETARVSELTAEFLQFSKPHSTQFEIQLLEESIQRVVYLMESEATYLGCQLDYEVVDSPVYARIDTDKIVQLLINLVRNAFDAMDDGGTVTIRLYLDEDNAVIEVRDTGSGIPESQLDEIFNPFYTTKESGTGLGLSICHQIMQVHGGTIEVESVEQRGTTFRLSLPPVREEAPQTQAQSV